MAPATPLQAAQDLIYQAMDCHNTYVREALAQRALEISPDCADAVYTKEPPEDLYDDRVTMGGADEAYSYAETFRKVWAETPGALVWLKTGRTVLAEARPGRNEACPCGSGKKYKKCCGR